MAIRKMKPKGRTIPNIAPPKKRWPFKRITVYLFILVIFSVVYTYCFDSKLNLNGDNASYYLLGKSISQGEGYHLANDLSSKPHNHFPPGYPVILGVLMLFSKSTLFLKFSNGLLLFASLCLSFELLKKLKASWQLSLVSVVFMMLNYHLIKAGTTIMSEMPYMLFSLSSIFLLLGIDFTGDFWKTKRFIAFLLLLSFSFHIRTIGIALLGGVIFYLLFDRKWKGLLFTLTGFILLALPWFFRGKVLGIPGSYQNQLLRVNPYDPSLGNVSFGGIFERIVNNFGRYISFEIPSGVLPFFEVNYRIPAPTINWIIGVTLTSLILFGLFKLPKYRSLLTGYLLGTFAVLLVWPDVWRGVRFLMPLLPILIFLILFALSVVLDFVLQFLLRDNFKRAWVVPILLLPIGSVFLREYIPNTDNKFQSYPLARLKVEADTDNPKKWENYFRIAEYVKGNLPATINVACRKPQLFHVYSDSYSCLYPYEASPEKLIETLVERKVDYVVVDQLGYSSTGKFLVPAIKAYPRKFKVIFQLENPNSYLLKFNPAQK